MATAQSIIESSLRKLGNHTPTQDNLNKGLLALNAMLASWASETLTLFASVEESFTLSTGTNNYTIGSSGTFNTVRPDEITEVFTRSNNQDYPIKLISRKDYSLIDLKTTQGRPFLIYYAKEYPLGKMFFYYTPDSNYSLHIKSEKPLTSFSALSTTMNLPGDYERALFFNLAIDLSFEYDSTLPNNFLAIAEDIKIKLKNKHAQPIPYAKFDNALTVRSRNFDINTGEFR